MGLADKMEKVIKGELKEDSVNNVTDNSAKNTTPVDASKSESTNIVDSKPAVEKSKKVSNNLQNKNNTKKAVRPNSNASKLHTHLNQVGEDGLTMKDRIELEVQAQAKKVKKIIFAACGVILLFCLLIFAVSRCSSSSSASRKTTKAATSVMAADEIKSFRSKSFALVRTDEFNSAVFYKQCDDLIKKHPSFKSQIEEVKERLEKNYPLQFK